MRMTIETPAAFIALLLLLGVLAGCGDSDSTFRFGTSTSTSGSGNGNGNGNGNGGATSSDSIIPLAALFNGAQFASGPPSAGTTAPFDGQSDVSPTTPVVIIFSESIDASTVNPVSLFLVPSSGFGGGGGGAGGGGGGGGGGGIFGGGGGGLLDDLLGGGGGGDEVEPVQAAVFVDPLSADRVAVLLPHDPLEPGTRYTVNLSSQITDLEGQAVSSESPTTFSFETAQEGNPFYTLTMYPAPGSANNARDSHVLVYFSRPVKKGGAKGITTDGNMTVRVGGADVSGNVELLEDPRLVRFTPDAPFAPGSSVVVAVRGVVADEEGTQLATAFGNAFEERFEVTRAATPSSITFPGTGPLMVGGLAYHGVLTNANIANFKTDVAFDASAKTPDEVSLVFFQPRTDGGASSGRLFTRPGKSGFTRFDTDLTTGAGDQLLVDTGLPDPPLPILVGAYATRNGVNSPVGPLIPVPPFGMPGLFKKTSEPEVFLGPPTEAGRELDFRSVLRQPAIIGRSSEDLTYLRFVLDVTAAQPSILEGLTLGEAGALTRDGFFMTGVWNESVAGAGPRFLPTTLGEMRLRDTVDNTFVVRPPRAGRIHQEGTVGGPLDASATDSLRVRVVSHDRLLPMQGVDVLVTPFPYDPLAPFAITRTTKKTGEVALGAAELQAFGPNLMITAVKKGHDLFTIAGVRNPGMSGSPFGVSLLLKPSGEARPRLNVSTENDIAGLVTSFKAASTNTGSGVPSPAAPFSDERFAVAGPLPGADLGLDVDALRPHVVTGFEADGAGSFVFQQSGVLVTDVDGEQSFDFESTGGLPPATRFANTLVPKATITGAGISGDPVASSRARLIGRLPGLPDVVPLSMFPGVEFTLDPTRVILTTPVPPTLELDEPLGDPLMEILLQPSAGIGGGHPSQSLLEDAFRLEVEAADAGTTRMTRFRAQLNFGKASSTVPTTEAISLPVIPLIAQAPDAATPHPPTVALEVTDFLFVSGVFRFTLRSSADPREWVVLAAPSRVPDAAVGKRFTFPDVKAPPFQSPGSFEVTLEAIEMPFGSFSFDSFVLSDLAREHRRLARSDTVTVTTSTP